jgi:hypothetical protein
VGFKEQRAEELKPYIKYIRDYDDMINLPDAEYKKKFAEVVEGAVQSMVYQSSVSTPSTDVIGGIEVSDYPLELSKVLQIQEAFVPKWEEKQELEKDLEEFNKKYDGEEISDEMAEEAKVLAKRAQKIRTSSDKIHKTEKTFYWEGGKLVDAFRNAIKKPIEDHEARLKEITEYEKRKEEERLAKLQEDRVKELSKYVEDAEERTLNEMDEEMWEAYLFKKKADHEKMLKEQEEQRKKEEEEQRLVELYNNRKEELIPYWNYLKGDTKSADFSALPKESFDLILDEAKEAKKVDDEKKVELQKEAEELRKKEEKRRKRSQEMNPYLAHIEDYDGMLEMSDKDYSNSLSKAKEFYEKAEAERKEEERAKKEAEEAERKAKNAPDKEKLQKLAEDINGLDLPELNTDEAKDILEDVETLLGKVVNYITEESIKL